MSATKDDDAWQVVEVFPLERSPNEGIRNTIGFGTLRFGEQVDDKVDCELPFFTLQHCTLTQWTCISSLNALIMSNKTLKDGFR